MPKLNPQEEKVYRYILANPGCTTHDITRDTFIQKPCARIVGLESKGIKVTRNGEVKYPGTRPFAKLYIDKPFTKQVQKIDIVDGVAVRTYETVPA